MRVFFYVKHGTIYFCKCSRNEIFKSCRVAGMPFSRRSCTSLYESLLLMQTMYKEGCLSKPAKESLVLFSEVSSIGSFSSRTERGMLRDLESESI
jgi:hypothetical protein